MNRWIGKIAVVTGASSGIGAAVATDLARSGMKVIGLARRQDRIDQLIQNLPSNITGSLVSRKCDISKEDEITSTFKWIESEFGGVDVLINNAGVTKPAQLTDPKAVSIIREVVETNLMGLVNCSREAVQSMKKRSLDGHIININSIAGHHVQFFNFVPPIMNIYPGTKHAVTAVTETLRQELIFLQTKIRVTSISPGMVRTEMIPDTENEKLLPMLKAEDIAEAIRYVLSTPPHVQVHELTIKPVGEQF